MNGLNLDHLSQIFNLLDTESSTVKQILVSEYKKPIKRNSILAVNEIPHPANHPVTSHKSKALPSITIRPYIPAEL